MEIRSAHMYQEESQLQTPPAPCSVCEEIFQPADDFDFICRKCQSALAGHCCEYDDVHMDWGVELEGEYPYFWIIECICGNESKSRLHSINEQGAIAKELHAEWLLRLPTKHAPDVVESAASVSISPASEVSASEADSTPATTQVKTTVMPLLERSSHETVKFLQYPI